MSSHEEHDLNPPRRGHHPARPQAVGYEKHDGKSEIVAVTEFDFASLDDDKQGMPAFGEEFDQFAEREVFMLFGGLWAEVLEWIYVPKNARLVGMRFKAVLYCCRPQLLNNGTLETIAQKEGCTKQTFQALTKSFRKHFKIVCRSMRTNISRQHMRDAALRIHARKKTALSKGGIETDQPR